MFTLLDGFYLRVTQQFTLSRSSFEYLISTMHLFTSVKQNAQYILSVRNSTWKTI